MKRLYISTPINGLPFGTIEEKLIVAQRRIKELKRRIRRMKAFDEYTELVSTFDVNPIEEDVTEAEAMGRCIRLVMECDAIVMDWERDWHQSKGCRLEKAAAQLYGKKVLALNGSCLP